MFTVPMTNTAAAQAAGMHLTITNTQPQFGAFVFLSGAAITGAGANPNPVPGVHTTPSTSQVTFTASPSPITLGRGSECRQDNSNLECAGI